MNLLVTGGAGFIGSNLIHHVIDRPEVSRLVNLDSLTYAGHLENLAGIQTHAKYSFERCDIRDRASVVRVVRQCDITHVIHLAAETHVDRSIESPGDFILTNVVGTFHLLEACRAAWLGAERPAACRFLHVSTDEVYGSLGPEGRFTETSPYAPNSPYAASKASGEMHVRACHRTYGLPVAIANPSNCQGPRQFPEKLIPVVIQCALHRRPIPVYGNGMNVRDWLHVADLAEALWRVLTRGRDGERYNVGAGNERPNLELVRLICDQVDELAGFPPGSSRDRISFVSDRPGHDWRYAIDATRIREELGWKPAVPFEKGLRDTVKWYVDNQDWVKAVTKPKPVPVG